MALNFSERDKQSLWHPYTHQFNVTGLPVIVSGKGAWLYDEHNNALLDGISSWWVTLFGHCQPEIVSAVFKQSTELEQVIFAGFSHPQAILLAERLIKLAGNSYSKVFFSDNGSTAVEVALKIALQYFQNQGIKNRTKIICLQNGYHGDTFGAMSVSERSIFTWAFRDLLFEVISIPAPLDIKTAKETISELEDMLKKEEIATFIYEPLLQGSSGMQMYPPEPLNFLLEEFQKHKVICIADEVFTGFFRTGTFLASHQLEYQPDIICLSKALTGGFLPLGATLVTPAIYEAFHQPEKRKMLFHGHSFTANPLACAAANATISLLQQPNTLTTLKNYCSKQQDFAQELGKLKNVNQARHLGMVVAAEIENARSDYTSHLAAQISTTFLQKNIILRPLGNTLYLLPPLFITPADHKWLHETCLDVLSNL